MSRIALPITVLGAFVGVLLQAAPVEAANVRSWVASFGSGATCSRLTPCADFNTAYAQTVAGGVINCVDSGEYGSVLINHALTIDCTGTLGGATGTAININAGPNDDIVLRGLVLHGSQIFFQAGRSLTVNKVFIDNFPLNGILFNPSGNADLFVSDSIITNTGANNSNLAGIYIQPAGTAVVRAVISGTHMDNNSVGLWLNTFGTSAGGGITASLVDSSVSGNRIGGIVAGSAAAVALLIMDRTTVSMNGLTSGDFGVYAAGANSLITLSNSLLQGNFSAVLATGGGQVLSYKDNVINLNIPDGTPVPAVGAASNPAGLN